MNRDSNDLPRFLSGQVHELNDPKAGLISYYVDGPDWAGCDAPSAHEANPLILVHSINAAASAHEVKPLFDFFKTQRRVYAIDLPGYGHSERSDRPYLPRLMVDALHALISRIRSENHCQKIDALAVSLSCEFLARAAKESPDAFRSIGFVSPTGFQRRSPTQAPPGTNRGSPIALRVLKFRGVGRALFGLLTTAPSIRYFLQRTWGSKKIDDEMFENSVLSARQPGAQHAPFHFLSGYLFSADMLSVYDSIQTPVWVSHGVRGDFTDYSRMDGVRQKPDWYVTQFQTGAMPYFEVPRQFTAAYTEFLNAPTGDHPAGRTAS